MKEIILQKCNFRCRENIYICRPLRRRSEKCEKWYKLPPCIGMHALGLEFGSAAQLSKRPGSVWNCLWGNALKRSPGIIRKSRVSNPGPGFLSSATWLSLPKKHYNGLNQTSFIPFPTPLKTDRSRLLQNPNKVLDIKAITNVTEFTYILSLDTTRKGIISFGIFGNN